MADRPTYTRAQLEQYFDRIVLPQRQRIYSITEQLSNGSTTAIDQLAYLTLLVKHQVVKVPFENLSLHYSWHRTINVRPQYLFRKIVEKQPHAGAGSGGDGEPRPWQCNRGGYCMEANSFFHTVLRSLGYNVYLAGARVFNPQTQRYGGFSHCVNIVTLLGDDGVLQKYMVDVAFGANEAAMPLPLTANVVHTQIAPGQMRLVYEALPQNLNQDSKCWVYQQRIRPDAEWTPAYCFVDFEFLPEDIAGMNLSPWKSPSSFFHQKVLVVRFTTDRETLTEFEGSEDGPGSPEELAVAEGELDGAIILDHDKLKWRRNGETKMEVVLKTDAERVEALRRYFGIVFDEEDLVAIKGSKGEIKS